MRIGPKQSRGGATVGRLLQSAWRYKELIAAAVLLGALLGIGWTANQPTLYEAAAHVATSEYPPTGFCTTLHRRAVPAQQLMTSPAVLEQAVKLSGSKISAEALSIPTAAPQMLTGIVAANIESYTIADSFEEVVSPNHTTRYETRRVISYGAAVVLSELESWLNENIPFRVGTPWRPE